MRKFLIAREHELRHIQKAFRLFIFLVVFWFCTTNYARAAEIANFHSQVDISSNRVITVTEKIEYDLGKDKKHFVERLIPYKRPGFWGRSFGVSGIMVEDEAGDPVAFSVFNENNNKKIIIGSETKELSGRQVFVVSYDTARSLDYSQSGERLEWEAIGNSALQVRSARVDFNFPNLINSLSLHYSCQVGGIACLSDRLEFATTTLASQAVFIHESIMPGQAMVADLSFPFGTFSRLGLWRYWWGRLIDFRFILAPMLILGLYLIFKKRKKQYHL